MATGSPSAGSPRARLILVAGLVLAALAGGVWYVTVWEPRSHVPADVVYWYRRQFEPGQLRPGWRLTSVGRDVDRPNVLVHRVQVPGEFAGDLVMMGTSERRRLVAEIACPAGDHEIWRKLRRRHDVVVELITDKGEFATVSCRAEVY